LVEFGVPDAHMVSSSSSYICRGFGPLVDPFQSHVSRSSVPKINGGGGYTSRRLAAPDSIGVRHRFLAL
jgi:hypothetical protein